MKQKLLLGLILLAIALPICAQKKSRAGSASKTKPSPAITPAKTDVAAEATEAANTLKGLTKFIYLYGKVSNGFEIADEQARKTRVPASVIEQNTNNKNALIRSISGQKDAVDRLAKILEPNQKLQVQFINLAGVTQKISEAMALVGNNQYDEAGRSLLTAADRLTDILQQIK